MKTLLILIFSILANCHANQKTKQFLPWKPLQSDIIVLEKYLADKNYPKVIYQTISLCSYGLSNPDDCSDGFEHFSKVLARHRQTSINKRFIKLGLQNKLQKTPIGSLEIIINSDFVLGSTVQFKIKYFNKYGSNIDLKNEIEEVSIDNGETTLISNDTIIHMRRTNQFTLINGRHINPSYLEGVLRLVIRFKDGSTFRSRFLVEGLVDKDLLSEDNSILEYTWEGFVIRLKQVSKRAVYRQHIPRPKKIKWKNQD